MDWRLWQNTCAISQAQSGKQVLFDVISERGWWAKNVIPEYTYSRSDIKELNLSDKQLNTTSINRLVIRARGAGRDDAVRMARDIERYIQGMAACILQSRAS